MIKRVTVNHEERNYFDDYDELRIDTMSCVTDEKVARAIDKLVRRFRAKGATDAMFVEYEDGSGYSLMFKVVGAESYEHPTFGAMYRGGEYKLVLRHYTYVHTDSWNTEEIVSASGAKKAIIREEM